jgi:hypothetical protein
VRARSAAPIRFDLSKIARVGLVATEGERTHYAGASTTLGRGRQSLWWPVPRRRGLYTVRLTATDLAGNTGVAEQVVEVLAPRRPRSRGK